MKTVEERLKKLFKRTCGVIGEKELLKFIQSEIKANNERIIEIIRYKPRKTDSKELRGILEMVSGANIVNINNLLKELK